MTNVTLRNWGVLIGSFTSITIVIYFNLKNVLINQFPRVSVRDKTI
jgi:hypothetical protein